MSRLVLVRHAMPAFGPELPPHQWELQPDGHAAARRLADALPRAAYLVASEEPKAWQTLAPAGPVVRDPRFNEVQRDEPFQGDFRARRGAYVAGTAHPGWEVHAAVVARFDSAVADHLVRAGDRTLVVGSHGMAMTVWLASGAGLASRVDLADPVGFWSALALPDALIVDLATGTVTPLAT